MNKHINERKRQQQKKQPEKGKRDKRAKSVSMAMRERYSPERSQQIDGFVTQLQFMQSDGGDYSKENFFYFISDLPQAAFDDFCNAIISYYSFMVRYEGVKIIDYKQTGAVQLKFKFQSFTFDHLMKSEISLDSLKFFKDLIEPSSHYSKTKCFQYLSKFTQKEFNSFCNEILSLKHHKDTSVGWFIDLSLEASKYDYHLKYFKRKQKKKFHLTCEG